MMLGGGAIEQNSYFLLTPLNLDSKNVVLCARFDDGGG